MIAAAGAEASRRRHAVTVMLWRRRSRRGSASVIKAAALYMVELKSGRVLLEKNATRRLPPASLTKIMTALVALESAPLQQVIKIDRRALVHRSSLKFQAGEEFLCAIY